MAQTLQSPGVNVSVINQSFYAPAAPGTIPLLFIATEQDKSNASGTGIAQGTTAENAGTVWVITSQRDLVDTFGTPYFQTVSGTPVHGSEINEYGLQAAYSVLGVSSQAYVVRAPVDLSAMVGSSTQPTGTPIAGTVWLNTSDSTFGVNVWSTSTNNGQGGFTSVTPLVIDNSNYATAFSGSAPVSSFGVVGNFAMVAPNSATGALTKAQLYFKSASLGWVSVSNGFDGGKYLTISPNYGNPTATYQSLNAANGSVWICTNSVTGGSIWDFKYYSGSAQAWTTVNAPVYLSRQDAIANLDNTTGGLAIPLNSIFVDTDSNNIVAADFKTFVRSNTGPSTISVTSSTTVSTGGSFNIRETSASGNWINSSTIRLSPGGTLGNSIAAGINTSTNLVNVNASWNPTNSVLTISHTLGGEIELVDGTGTPLSIMGIKPSAVGTIAGLNLSPTGDNGFALEISNWSPATYYSQSTAPGVTPPDGYLWFNNYIGDADILYNNGTAWIGYRNAFPNTDINGPIISATAPTTQSSGIANSLVTGDIWINSASNVDFGTQIYVYNSLAGAGTNGWVLQDTTDHVSPNGWLFADARWATSGATPMSTVVPITSMLTSNFLDSDCPSARLYARGTRLFNTRRSSNNVKYYDVGYVNLNGTNANNGNEPQTSYYPNRWVTASANNEKGQGQFGRLSQRSVVVSAMQALIQNSTAIRDTDTLNYNLIACPGYPETIPTMVNLNTDIGQLALVLGDTPMRLLPDATTLNSYGKNSAKVTADGEQGLVTHDPYLAVYYPSGYTTDNYGNNIVVPSSHIMLHTIINSDNVSYPWFAPAGTRRGIVTNASSVGYVSPTTGQFTPTSLYGSLRDVLSGVEINPIATLPGSGLTVMGQYTRDANSDALNRVNVARLVAYLRRQLATLAKPFLFEPNDSQTRNEIRTSIENLLLELVGQRALYDFVVVCDKSNNTPTRIDMNELWVDIAIEPVKAVEFIYIPLRLLNTGAIASGNFGSQSNGSNNSTTG